MPTADEIARLSYEDLGRLDPSSLSREERRAARSRSIQLEADQERANAGRRNLGLGARTVASGLLGIPAGLADAAQWAGRQLNPAAPAYRAVGVDQPSVDFSGSLERGLDAVGLPRPEGFNENAVYDVGSNLIGMATPMGALRALPRVAAAVPRLARFLTERPLLQSSMATTGGLGQATAGEVSDHNPWAEVAGGVAGAFAPAGAVSAASRLRSLLSPAAREAARREAAAGTVRSMASDPEAIVPAIEGNVDPLPGATRSLAEVTQDPRLSAAERVMRDDPNSGAAFVDADAARATARARGLEEAAPGAPDASGVSTALQSQIDDLAQTTDAVMGNSQVRLTGRVRDVGAEPVPGATPAEVAQGRGNTVRSGLQASLDDLRNRAASAFGGIDPQQGSRIPVTQMLEEADQSLASQFQHMSSADPAASDVRRLITIRDFIEENASGGNASFAMLERQRNALLEIAANSGREDVTAAANAMVEAIDRGILPNRAPRNSGLLRAGDRNAVRAGRDLQAEQQRLFSDGPVATALDPATAPENVAARLAPPDRLPGAASAPQQAIEALGNNPAAVQALQQSLAERIVSAGRRGPDIDPARLEQAIAGHGQALSQFPELQSNLQALLADAQRHGRLSELSGEALTRARSGAAQAWLGQVDTSSAMSRMLANSQAQSRIAGELMRRIGHDQNAVDAARGAFRDMLLQHATRAGGDLNLTALSNAASRYGEAARVIMGQQGLTRLNSVIRDVRSELANQARAQSTPGAPTQPRQSVARMLTGLIARHAMYHALPGPSWMKGLIAAARRGSGGANPVITQMVARAMADPQFALELLRPAGGGNVQRAAGVLENMLRAGETGIQTEGRERN